MIDMCIYHKGCFDGFTAAWAIWRRFPTAEFIPAGYGDEPPDVTGKTVIIVDFSYPRDVLEAMHAKATWLHVLDHHKTAEAALHGLEYAYFDMEQSGAMMAWYYIHGNSKPPPDLVAYVQDRDLWRFALPSSEAINAYIMAHKFDFATWNGMYDMLETRDGWRQAETIGNYLRQQHQQFCQMCIGIAKTEFVIADNKVPAVNAPHFLASEIGNILSTPADVPFAATYYFTPDEMRVSLRSHRMHGADVSEIARKYGGGGHKNAAGFAIPRCAVPDFGLRAEYEDDQRAHRETTERELQIALARAERLEGALSFYANPDNWRDTPSWDGDPDCITPKAIPVDHAQDGSPCDCGDIARAALTTEPQS